MNAFGITLVWSAVQVSVLGLLVAGGYLLACRRRPFRATSLLTAGLLAVLAVSVLALSPWPNWVTLVPGKRTADASQSEPRAQASGPAATPSNVHFDPARSTNPAAEDDTSFAGDPRFREPTGWAKSFTTALLGEWNHPRASDTASRWRWPAIAAALFLAGTTLLLLRLAFGLWLVDRTRKSASLLTGTEIDALLAQIKRDMHLPRPVTLRESASITTPATLGWRQPTILLPTTWTGWSDRERRAVLSHELAHVAAGDYLTGIIAELARALHFYNPLVRWMASRLRLDQEWSADATAASYAGGPRRYLESLARLALESDDRSLGLLVQPFLPPRGTLLRRIDMLRSRITSNAPTTRPTQVIVIATFASIALFVAGVRLPASDTESNAYLSQSDSELKADSLGSDRKTEGDNEEPLPTSVIRVFGDERFRTWRISYALAMSPDGKTIASGGLGHVQLTDTESGREQKIIEIERHDGPLSKQVWSLDFGADGQRLAIGTGVFQGNGGIEIWDPAEMKKVFEVTVDFEKVNGIALMSDTNQVVCSGNRGNQGVIQFWNIATQEKTHETIAHTGGDLGGSYGVALSVSPDGQQLASGGADGLVKVWNRADMAHIRTLEGHGVNMDGERHLLSVNAVAFSSDGKRLASTGWDNQVHLWDLNSGQRLNTIRPVVRGSYTMVQDLAFSPDGNHLALGLHWNMGGGVELVDAKNGDLEGEVIRHTDYVWNVAFTRDSKRLFSIGLDTTVQAFDLDMHQVRNPPSAHKGIVGSIAFSPDGRNLFSTGSVTDGLLRVWNVQTGKIERTIDLVAEEIHGRAIRHLTVSDDGKLLALAGPDAVRVLDFATGRTVLTTSGGYSANACFSPDAKLLASVAYGYAGRVAVAEISTREVQFQTQLKSLNQDDEVFSCRGIALTNGKLYVADWAGLKCWDIEKSELLFHTVPSEAIWCLAATRDGHLIAAGTRGDSVELYRGATGERLATVSTSPNRPFALSFSSDGRLLACADDRGRVILWKTEDATVLRSWQIGQGAIPVFDIAFSLDERYLATANANGTAYLLEVPEE